MHNKNLFMVMLLFLAASLTLVSGAREVDRLKVLPGFADAQPPSAHFSGCNITQ